MNTNRIYLGEAASRKLRSLQQRTQMTPNLLCRIGLCISLEDDKPIDLELHDDGKVREFNMPTLLGEYHELFVALLRERIAIRSDVGEDRLADYLRAHISRGVSLLSVQVKSVGDLTGFVRFDHSGSKNESAEA